MSYFKDIDTWISDLLIAYDEEKIDYEEFKQTIKDKLLQSYRNGQAAGPSKPEAKARPRTDHERPVQHRHRGRLPR